MKKLIINVLGIGCVFTFIAMVVMAVCFTDKDDNRINISGNKPASMHNSIDRLSDNIKSQNVVARSDSTYRGRSNLGYAYESSNGGYPETYDSTDYPDEDSFDLGNASSDIGSDDEIEAADNIE